MSQENVETTRAGLDAWSRRDIEALIELLHPEVEWHPALQRLVGGEAVVVSEVYDLGERVAALAHLALRGRQSRLEIESPVGVVVDFREHKMLCVRTYLGHTEALEAAGLSE